MKRGDIVIATFRGDFGKPRPCVVLQADRFIDDFDSVLVCPLSSTIEPTHIVRIPMEPSPANGLREPSVITTDKTTTILKRRIGTAVGAVDATTMDRITFALALLAGMSTEEI